MSRQLVYCNILNVNSKNGHYMSKSLYVQNIFKNIVKLLKFQYPIFLYLWHLSFWNFTALECYVDCFIHAHQLHDKWNDRISPFTAVAIATATKTTKTPFCRKISKKKVVPHQHYDSNFPCKSIHYFDAFSCKPFELPN